MVERLKFAIEKARATRAQSAPGPSGDATAETVLKPAPPVGDPRPAPGAPAAHEVSTIDDRWLSLPELRLNTAYLEQKRIVSYRKSDPAHLAFDLLRTRVLALFQEKGWTRIAITSPNKNCGKSLVACNLALSLSRQPSCKTVLVDADLRAPSIANYLGTEDVRSIRDFLSGAVPAPSFLQRIGHNLAVGLNREPVKDSSELLHNSSTALALSTMQEHYQPDIVIFDLPPILGIDDTVAFLPNVDCVLLVVAAGQTSASEVEESEQSIPEETNYLGVLLNKVENGLNELYQYNYV